MDYTGVFMSTVAPRTQPVSSRASCEGLLHGWLSPRGQPTHWRDMPKWHQSSTAAIMEVYREELSDGHNNVETNTIICPGLADV